MSKLISRVSVGLVALSVGIGAPSVRAQDGGPYYGQDQNYGQGGQFAAQQGPQQNYDRRQIERDLAPIALYPDQLVSQILMAATYPLEVSEAADWARDPRNSRLRGDELARALEQVDWDPSVKALVPFSNILDMLNSQPDWMQRLGEEFLAQENDVMDAVQRLRQQAYDAGTLRSNDRLAVRNEGPVFFIEPAQPDFVSVPYYDPRVAYGEWAYPEYPPLYFPPPPTLSIGFGVPYFGFAFFAPTPIIYPLWGWCRPDWGRHTIVINNINIYVNLNVYRRPLFRGDVWQHDWYHRRAVAYQSAPLRNRWERGEFGPRDFNRDVRFQAAARQFEQRTGEFQRRRQQQIDVERRQLVDIQRRPEFRQQIERQRGARGDQQQQFDRQRQFGQQPQFDRQQQFDRQRQFGQQPQFDRQQQGDRQRQFGQQPQFDRQQQGGDRQRQFGQQQQFDRQQVDRQQRMEQLRAQREQLQGQQRFPDQQRQRDQFQAQQRFQDQQRQREQLQGQQRFQDQQRQREQLQGQQRFQDQQRQREQLQGQQRFQDQQRQRDQFQAQQRAQDQQRQQFQAQQRQRDQFQAQQRVQDQQRQRDQFQAQQRVQQQQRFQAQQPREFQQQRTQPQQPREVQQPRFQAQQPRPNGGQQQDERRRRNNDRG